MGGDTGGDYETESGVSNKVLGFPNKDLGEAVRATLK